MLVRFGINSKRLKHSSKSFWTILSSHLSHQRYSNQTGSRQAREAEEFLSSFGKHMAFALTASLPEDIGFPIEILLPIAFLLALLGLCVWTSRPDSDPFLLKPFEKAPPTETVRSVAMFSQSPPRATRPPEMSPSSRSPVRESLICLCPSLVVPERVECTILVPQVSSLQLETKQLMPLRDLSGGTIFQLEVFPEQHLDGTRQVFVA